MGRWDGMGWEEEEEEERGGREGDERREEVSLREKEDGRGSMLQRDFWIG